MDLSQVTAVINMIVPDVAANYLMLLCELTGLRWGPTSRKDFWFQPPKLHIAFFFVVSFLFCGGLIQLSKSFRSKALLKLQTMGVGQSTKCPINTAIGFILIGCFLSQVYAKAIRPHPFVQLGWLLMPCHLTTLVWIYIFLHDKASHYANNCYLATLLVDWFWAPAMAAASPDWGDHQFPFEGYAFIVHHGLLLVLPFYFAARYHTLKMSKEHLYHLTWIPLLINFAGYAPYGLLSGLNLGYQIYPPPVSSPPAFLLSPYYRVFTVPLLMGLSVLDNAVIRSTAEGLNTVVRRVKQEKRKAKFS